MATRVARNFGGGHSHARTPPTWPAADPRPTVARVAVMRKLATVIWHMLSKRKTYVECRAVAAA
jgi:hypothetical protein